MLVTIPLSSFMSEITFADVWDAGKEGTLERQANQTIADQFGDEIKTTVELAPLVLKELLHELEYRMYSDGWCPSKLAESSEQWIWEDANQYMQHNGCAECIGWVDKDEDDNYLDRVRGDDIEDERRVRSEDGQGYWVGPFQILQCKECKSMAKTAINARKLWNQMLNTEGWKYV